MAITTYTLPVNTTWKLSDNFIGVADVSGVYTAGGLGAPGITPLPSAVIEQQLGQIVKATSYDATYGGTSQFIFLAVPLSTTVTQGLIYNWKGDGTVVVNPTAVSSAATSGIPVALAINTVASNAASIQYTWFLVQGRGAALKGAALTAQPNSPLSISGVTAGRVRTTASAFRSFIGMRGANTATATGSILPVWLQFPSCGPGA
jgi:hypothetical protein